MHFAKRSLRRVRVVSRATAEAIRLAITLPDMPMQAASTIISPKNSMLPLLPDGATVSSMAASIHGSARSISVPVVLIKSPTAILPVKGRI